MESAKEAQVPAQTQTRRPPPEIRFPSFSLADSIAVAQAIHEQGGGRATRDQLAAFLNYNGVRNGSFLSRVAAARTFNLITGERGGDFTITPLAQKILMPVYQEQAIEGMVEAFLTSPLFKAIYEEHKGKELPPEFGMKNLLRTKYGIKGTATDTAYRSLMASAEQAKFFAARGTRTHLIMPMVSPPRKPDESAETPATPPAHGGGNGTVPPTPPSATADHKEQLRLKYVDKLFEMIDTTDDKDEKKALLDRIEQFLKG